MANGWVDVLVFAAIAGFLWLKLRKSLGETKEGGPKPIDLPKIFSGQPTAPTTNDVADDAVTAMPLVLRDQLPNYNVVSSATAHQQLLAMLGVYAGFNPLEFLAGAKRALPLIVHAYAAGDQPMLDKLLVGDLAQNFAQKIAARTTPYNAYVHEVKKATIAGAKADNGQALITVDFVSVETINNQPKKDVHDTWTFVKNITDDNNIWLLHTIHDAIED